MNYDTSIILIGNKSGQGENKERRICASLRGERERTKAAANHSDSQIGQHWNRQGKAASELEQATMLASLSLLPPSSRSCSGLTDLPSNVRSRQTSNRRRGRGQLDAQTDAWEVLWVMTRTCASWSIKLFKSVAQCTWVRPGGRRGTHWGPGHVFNVSQHDGWLWLWPTTRPSTGSSKLTTRTRAKERERERGVYLAPLCSLQPPLSCCPLPVAVTNVSRCS